MAVPLNAKRLADRIRQKIEDRNAQTFSDDTEILEAADEALETIFTQVRLAGRGHSRDYLDVPVGSLTTLQDEVREYALPRYVGDVQRVELTTTNGAPPFKVEHVNLDLKDAGRGVLGYPSPFYHYSKRSGPGRIEIRGRLGNHVGVRIYFTRRWPPLFYGTLSAGTQSAPAGLSSSIGRVVPRDDIYNEMQIECYEDATNAVNVDHITYVTDYAGATKTFTVEDAFPAAISPGVTKIALIVPLDPEHNDYLSEIASFNLLGRMGSYAKKQDMLPSLLQLKEEFIKSLNQRDNSAPNPIYNSW